MKKKTAKEVAQVKWKWPVRCYELQHTNTQWLDNPLAECEGIRSGGMCSMHVNFYVLVFFCRRRRHCLRNVDRVLNMCFRS